jgi:EAL domain-containing protein (putative c-di-GMP-specific phosphodiesterase class I)
MIASSTDTANIAWTVFLVGSENSLQRLIAMGSSLCKRMVAEGIENQEQLDFLKTLNCKEGHGFLFNPPLTAEQFARLLTTGIEYDQPNGYLK